MPIANKRQKHSQKAAAIKKAKYKKVKEWKDVLASLREHDHKLKNPRGRVREPEENKLIMLSVIASLERRLNEEDNDKISWTAIDREIVDTLHCHISHVSSVCSHFEKHKELPDFDIAGRGGASETYDRDKQSTIKAVTLVAIASYVDEMHAKGAPVTNKKVRGMLTDKYQLNVTRQSVQWAMKKLGLSWRPSKPKARTLGAYQLEAIQKYLIKLDEFVKEMESGNPHDLVFVFTDESYIHPTHSVSSSYHHIDSNQRINKSASKGRRLIILHAITRDGPLCKCNA
jgi:hypothetical protein